MYGVLIPGAARYILVHRVRQSLAGLGLEFI
jgi:hypothetical protein